MKQVSVSTHLKVLLSAITFTEVLRIFLETFEGIRIPNKIQPAKANNVCTTINSRLSSASLTSNHVVILVRFAMNKHL